MEKRKENKILIAGPPVIQDYDICYDIAKEVKRCSELYNFIPIFKVSFDNYNQSLSKCKTDLSADCDEAIKIENVVI